MEETKDGMAGDVDIEGGGCGVVGGGQIDDDGKEC